MSNVMERLSQISVFPKMQEKIMHGDMPGDKIEIQPSHLEKAKVIFPVLVEKLAEYMEKNPYHKAVVCVCGGSGVGKSETASLLGQALQNCGIGSYILSGDNYPHRIPKQNDAERLRVYRCGAVRGLVNSGLYDDECKDILRGLQESGRDAAPEECLTYPWLGVYQREGKKALSSYLGTDNEQNFAELSHIIAQFKTGADKLYVKRMGRTELDLWYDALDVSDKHVLIIEWTHGNSDRLVGVDLPILLNSTPQETLEHRRSRNRDGAVDSPFTMAVLEVEQGQLEQQAHKAAIIVSKKGDLLTYAQYCMQMAQSKSE